MLNRATLHNHVFVLMTQSPTLPWSILLRRKAAAGWGVKIGGEGGERSRRFGALDMAVNYDPQVPLHLIWRQQSNDYHDHHHLLYIWNNCDALVNMGSLLLAPADLRSRDRVIQNNMKMHMPL